MANSSNGGHVILAFAAFSLVIGRENGIIESSNKGGKPDSMAKIRRAAFGHAVLVAGEVAGLSDGRINACTGDEFFRGGKA